VFGFKMKNKEVILRMLSKIYKEKIQLEKIKFIKVRKG